ncbi:VWA domain-containing protein [Streptomyces sp. XD-27]|uniref:VWA domain-containing protein n=1 Tax=Streptomyces sp. XD-27 TaxID=3062779 RepID=UPI0026F43D45|nr:VWA domain-containing protein [Streptomyces sp. XD-27]WKX68916.1 VWA domain-containing protein [Streptomyces sp. XD-27]
MGGLTAALILVISVVPGTAAPTRPPEPEPAVTPARVQDDLDPGGSLTVDKRVRTPAVPPRPDVVLLVDGTGSMRDSIANIEDQLNHITDAVTQEQADARFAVATYGDAVDGANAFQVLQGLTDDMAAVRRGVEALDDDMGNQTPTEDWINALWQVANNGEGGTDFRDGASPIVVLVGDASSHDPSMGHTLTEATNALQHAGARVLAVDIATPIGDGLNGNGDNGNGQPGEPTHEPNQATKVVNATGGTLFEGINSDQVADTIADGLVNLPTTVSYRTLACHPSLSVTLEPATRTVTSGETATFTETITAAEDAPPGAELTCGIQFLVDGRVPGGDGGDDVGADEPVPAYQQRITITVNDVDAPQVVVDDITVEATGKDGARIDFTPTAVDAVDGRLPATCDHAPGSLFPLGTTTVTCSATDSAGNKGTDTATFKVVPAPAPDEADLAVLASVAPARTYPGRTATATFTITNAGPKTAKGVVLSTSWPRTADASRRTVGRLPGCTNSDPCSIAPGKRLVVTQQAVYRTAVDGDVRVSVRGTPRDPQTRNNTAGAPLRVLQPRLTVTPEVGPPGQTVVARGKDFPPGSRVRLTWRPGITAARSAVRAGPDGTFEAQVLVLRKDRLGPRTLRAEVPGLDPLRRPFLVVQRHLEPPDFAGRS